MSLFSFANISFGSKSRKVGVDTKLGLKDDYALNMYRYPIDLGSSDKGHYMVFHINEQTRPPLTGREVNDNPTVIQNRLDKNIPSPTNRLTYAATGNMSKTIGFARTIRRISDTVALYMPDTLMFRNAQGYRDLSLTGLIATGSSILSQSSSITDNFKGLSSSDDFINRIKALGGSLSPAFATAVKDKSAFLSTTLSAITGVVINPMLEMIYTSPNFREFQFDFVFHPRSEKEAMEVQKIINRLYFHQAPEIENQGAGFFLIPPSEFDILFYYNGSINPNIPKISTCVLTNIDVNYAPSGFSAYEVQGEVTPEPGRTGMPVSIALTLNFKETEIMTKRNFDPGNGSLGVSSESKQMVQDWTKAGPGF
jgi:hypothetical protein